MVRAASVEVPVHIREWHEYVESEPKNHGKDIKDLKKLVEKLLRSKTVYYDPTDVEAFIDFCALVKHREGRWAGKPLELSIEQKYIVACVFGFKIYDAELDMNVRYFRELVLFVARKWGKALALDTPINTPIGWRTIGDVEIGDTVWGDDGRPTRVINTSEVFLDHDCFKVVFEDGEEIIADADHQWNVMTKSSRRMVNRERKSSRSVRRRDYHDGGGYFTVTTKDMAKDYNHVRKDRKGTDYKYRVPMGLPVDHGDKELPIDPYVLGVWIGDGESAGVRITSGFEDASEMFSNLDERGARPKMTKHPNCCSISIGVAHERRAGCNPIREAMKSLGLIGNKHIPRIYLEASIEQRRELLKGLMDTDGYAGKNGQCEFAQKSKVIIDGFSELLSSLGIKHTVKSKESRCNGKPAGTVYSVLFFVDKNTSCFKLQRKHNRLKNYLADRMKNKSIISIEPVASIPTKCISVDNESHLFLVGKRNTVTHNSTFISAVANFLLMADGEPAAQVWCLATQKQQASIVYESAKAFLQSSDVLTPEDNPRKHWRTKRDRDNSEMIMFPAAGSYMKAGSKNSNAQDGLNPHAFIIDECHAIKDRNTYDVFSSAGGARTQPLGVIISTYGFEREGIFDGILERCKKVLSGKSKERLFPMIFRIDDDDEPADRSCWIKANPGNREGRPTMGYLEGEYQKAKEDPAQMPSFLAKHLNRASSLSIVYFDVMSVDACMDDMTEAMIRDMYAAGGVDMAETTDLCCASALVPFGGRLHLFQKYFIARSRLEKNSKMDKMAYESFCRTKAADPLNRELLQICEGSMVRKSDVTAWYVELANVYGVTFWKIGYDRWHGGDWVDDMEANGFPREDPDGRGVTFPVAMGAKSLSVPMRETKSLFDDGIVLFSRQNGLFRWCVTNTAAKIDTNNGIQPDKAKSRARIDGYVSYLIAYVAYKKCVDDFETFQP